MVGNRDNRSVDRNTKSFLIKMHKPYLVVKHPLRGVCVHIIQFTLPTQETIDKGTRTRTANHSAEAAHNFPTCFSVL